MKVDVVQAKAMFDSLVEQVEKGETVLICRNATPIAELQPVATFPQARNVLLGWFEGPLTLSADFDAPMPDVEAAFYGNLK